MRSVRHANDPAAAGVRSLLEIDGRVADLGNLLRILDAQAIHECPDHVGVRSAAGDFIAGDAGIE